MPKTEPSTYRQIIQHFYFLQILNEEDTLYSITVKIQKDLKEIWGSVNPRLPLLSDKGIESKVLGTLPSVKNINRNSCKATKMKNLTMNLDRLFDISACKCKLPDKLPCNDR